jgi:hypothetical protein
LQDLFIREWLHRGGLNLGISSARRINSRFKQLIRDAQSLRVSDQRRIFQNLLSSSCTGGHSAESGEEDDVRGGGFLEEWCAQSRDYGSVGFRMVDVDSGRRSWVQDGGRGFRTLVVVF